MLKSPKKLTHFVLLISAINLLLFHVPFFDFVIGDLDLKNFNGIVIFASLIVLMLILNAFVFYLLLFISHSIGKFLLILSTNINALCIYFISTYGVMIDRTMMGNIFNTNFEESSSFFSFGLVLYLLFLGVFPSILIYKLRIKKEKLKPFLKNFGITLLFIVSFVYLNSSSWLWIDKSSKILGSLTMPWSYIVNTVRYNQHKNKATEKQILLPNATFKNNKKSVVVLVIGESARSANFSLYGYEKETNPMLSQLKNIKKYDAESCATYTTAGVKCILEHKETSDLYEILPNYLFRNDVEVIWRTTNWGEPKVTIKNYQKRADLLPNCKGDDCNYDGVLLSELKAQIENSEKNKILVVLHTSTSHGPTYYQKYPGKFNQFTPVCKSVELGKCTENELINAYDNTILYTDYIVATLIGELKKLEGFNSSMIYVSDHGESLGENNLYMHGIPAIIAPDEQLQIPFIVWTSENAIELKEKTTATQHHVFHSVLDFLSIESPIYNESRSIFE